MADRTIAITLTARADQYLRTFDEAARKSRETANSVELQMQRQREAFTQVGQAALAVGAIAATGVVMAVNAYAQFDAAMSNVAAVTRATAEEQDLLGQAALDAGARTVYSATEAAAAIEELAKAGLNTQQILGGGLDAALDLAAAGQLDVARAAEITAISLQQFGLSGDDATRVADLLAAGAGEAVGSVDDLANALKYIGPQARGMGIEVGEAVGVLALFAQNGILGEQAGTSLRGMLVSLTSPTARAREEIERLGITLYDQNGQFLGLENMAGQLSTAYAGMSDEARDASLGIIVGNESLQAANILLREGADGVGEWIDAVDQQGYAADVAADRLDNLKGDIEELTGAIETMLINLGEGGDGPLRLLVSTVTDVVNGFSDMPQPMQNVAIGALAVVAALGLTQGALLTLIPRIAETRAAWATMTTTAAGSRSVLTGLTNLMGGPWGIALAGATLAIAGITAAMATASQSSAEWQNTLRTGAVSAQTLLDTAGETTYSVQSLGQALSEMGTGRILWMDALGGDEAAMTAAQLDALANNLNEIGTQLAETANGGNFDAARAQFQALANDANLTDERIGIMLQRMPEFRDALIENATAAGENVTAGDEQAQVQAQVAYAMEGAAESAEMASDAYGGLTESQYDVVEAADEMLAANQRVRDEFFETQNAAAAYEQTIDDVAAALADGLVPAIDAATGGFDLGEQSGREADAMMQQMVLDADALALSLAETGASSEEVAAAQDRARQQIYNTGIQFGLTEEQARFYSEQLTSIPAELYTATQLETSAALQQLESFIENASRRTIVIGTQVATVSGATTPGGVRHGYNGGYADGGRIPGYAPGYDDRFGFDVYGNVYGLGGGEFIMPTIPTDKYLPELEQMRAGTYRGGYAFGGALGGATPTYGVPAGGGGGVVVNLTQNINGVEKPDGVIAEIASAGVAWAVKRAT